MNFSCINPRKARKEHRCAECQGIIFKGEKYYIIAGAYEGDFYCAKQCRNCHPSYMRVNQRMWKDGEGLGIGNLYEDVFESRNARRMKRFISIKLRRLAEVPKWMFDRVRKSNPYDARRIQTV